MREDLILSAAELGFEFKYARRDFQNLLNDVENNATYLVVDPIKTKPIRNDSGALKEKQHSGRFLLLRKSSLDEQYHEKVIAYIKPLEIDLEKLALQLMGCKVQYEVNWEYDEVVNIFDVNMDGLLVKFNIKQTI